MATNISDALNDFELLKGSWKKINWYLHYVIVNGSPVPAAIWVSDLIQRFNFTYREIDGWLQASAVDPTWECAIYAGFDEDGVPYIVARNVAPIS
jgi:hypothetical protein